MEPIILASSSQRRQEIFTQLQIPYRVIMPDIDETPPEGMALDKIPEYLASKKVDAVVRKFPTTQTIPWVFGADTLVFKDDKIYGKPENIDEARKILRELSGDTHTVITSVALFNGKNSYLSTRTCISKVTFAELSEEELESYLETDEWHGVAGAYRIQGKAQCFIKKIEGSYSSIVGLPIFEFYDILKEQGYNIL